MLVVGHDASYAPFKGGVMVPTPEALCMSLTIDAAGDLELTARWPDLSPGTQLYMQLWVPDPGGPAGWAASNALRVTSP